MTTTQEKDKLSELPEMELLSSATGAGDHRHRRTSSDLSELSLISFDFQPDGGDEVDINVIEHPKRSPSFPSTPLWWSPRVRKWTMTRRWSWATFPTLILLPLTRRRTVSRTGTAKKCSRTSSRKAWNTRSAICRLSCSFSDLPPRRS